MHHRACTMSCAVTRGTTLGSPSDSLVSLLTSLNRCRFQILNPESSAGRRSWRPGNTPVVVRCNSLHGHLPDGILPSHTSCHAVCTFCRAVRHKQPPPLAAGGTSVALAPTLAPTLAPAPAPAPTPPSAATLACLTLPQLKLNFRGRRCPPPAPASARAPPAAPPPVAAAAGLRVRAWVQLVFHLLRELLRA
jgi:hypothetical protein